MTSWSYWLIGAAAGLALFVAALPWLIRPVFRALLALRYGMRVTGRENVPRIGPALLTSNHVTWIDGFLIVAATPRRGKALVNASYIDVPVLRFLALRAGVIPVPFRGPRAQRAAIVAIQRALDRGEVVLIFPEGQLSRTGMLGPFYRGLEVMLKDRENIPVIPMYLGNLWGSVFSNSNGRYFRKRPRGLRRNVAIAFGPPPTPPVTAFGVRQAVLEAGVAAAELLPPGSGQPLETIDLNLPHWNHPDLGLLTGSTPDFDAKDVHQLGHKPGSLGLPAPGVALRVANADGVPLPPSTEGRLEALLPGRCAWIDTGRIGRLDRDGFVFVTDTA